MRSFAKWILVVFVFTIPWEFSLDIGEPFGNVARMSGLLLLIVAIPAVIQAKKMRAPGAMQWLVLALFLWFCCTCFWTVSLSDSYLKLRAYFQEMMVVWLVWEFVDTPEEMQALLRAFVAGSWMLAILTITDFASLGVIQDGQYRFAAIGQDPNDVARFLDIGFPVAALLITSEGRRSWRLLALGYLPVGLAALLLTASRSGFLAVLIALAGCGVLLFRRERKIVLAGALALPAVVGGVWALLPRETFVRLATIPGQLQHGDWNQRMNIWNAGWSAFCHAPLAGWGAGTFVTAARLSPIDTAHNSALSYLVSGGLISLAIAAGVVGSAAWSVLRLRGSMLIAFATALLVWVTTSIVATVEENRTTWLLLGLCVVAWRLVVERNAIAES